MRMQSYGEIEERMYPLIVIFSNFSNLKLQHHLYIFVVSIRLIARCARNHLRLCFVILQSCCILHSGCRSVVSIILVRTPFNCDVFSYGLKLKLASINKFLASVSANLQVRFVIISELNNTPLVHARGLHKCILSKCSSTYTSLAF
jgi:hypothetical protein